MLKCDGSSGVLYESIQPKSLEKIKHLEFGIVIQDKTIWSHSLLFPFSFQLDLV